MRFIHQICCSTSPEEDAQHYFNPADGSNFFLTDIELRHYVCDLCMGRVSNPIVSNPIRLNISLLHTCHQIYHEARFMLYSTNTFSFYSPRVLRAFTHLLIQRGVNVNGAMRSLCIDSAHINYDIHAWTQAFNAVTRHMTQLQRVYITVDQLTNWFTSASPAQTEVSMSQVLECLRVLGLTPAKSIMMIMSDQFLLGRPSSILFRTLKTCSVHFWKGTPACATRRWTMEEKELWVARVKSAMHDV